MNVKLIKATTTTMLHCCLQTVILLLSSFGHFIHHFICASSKELERHILKHQCALKSFPGKDLGDAV